MRHTASTKGGFGQGEVFNLIQSDTNKIIAFSWHLVNFVTIPVTLVYCTMFLTHMLGYAFLGGFAMFFIGAIINTLLAKGIQKGNKKKQKLIDRRLNYTTEALTNIKTLKFYQWTSIFEAEIEKRREAELKQLNRIRILLCVMWSTLAFFPNLMSTASLYLNIKMGNTIDLATAYTVLIFFNKIRDPMISLPWVITSMLELLVSMKRL
jgi:ATP-binding cassette subfamily C (CFTR/MRP) protein 1